MIQAKIDIFRPPLWSTVAEPHRNTDVGRLQVYMSMAADMIASGKALNSCGVAAADAPPPCDFLEQPKT